MLDYSAKMGLDVIEQPKKLMRQLRESMVPAQEAIIAEIQRDTEEASLEAKERIRIRFCNLPLLPNEVAFDRIPTLASQGRLISVSGTVIRVGAPRMIERAGKWECSRCKCEYEVEADIQQYCMVPKPPICTATIDNQDCRTSKFNKVYSFKPECEDYQEVKVQESTSNLEIGAVPRNLTIVLRADLVDACKAGDTVVAIGVLQSRWKPLRSTTKAEMEMFMEANNVLVNNREGSSMEVSIHFTAHLNDFWAKHGQSRLTGRSVIVDSFCPQIHGMFLPKLAVLLILLGGCSADGAEDDASAHAGSRSHRREGHLLFVGDPGTAKSQLLMGAARLVSRSVITTGSGSTNAGLTVTAVKDGGDWTLEAGALVLADKGICCIDEFSALRAHDRTSIHEAMEQQTLSVAKAGLVCKLNTRCSIIAACNSKGKFEEGETISSNTAIASPLLSRFDLILVMLDRRSKEWDQRLSTAIIEAACGGICAAQKSATLWDHDMLRVYIAQTKHHGQPRMGNAARVIISKYYQMQRGLAGRDAARTTVRLLESLIRLSQAHAKLLWQDEIRPHDAITAIVLMESSLQTEAMLGAKPDLYSGAPSDPVGYIEDLTRQILARLQINPAVFEKETDMVLEPDDVLDEILCSWAPTQP